MLLKCAKLFRDLIMNYTDWIENTGNLSRLYYDPDELLTIYMPADSAKTSKTTAAWQDYTGYLMTYIF